VPVLAVEAVRFNVCPLHNGELLPAVGVAGGLGSERLNGPTAFDAHPLLVTVMFEYEPADKFPMIIFPEPFAMMLILTNPAGPVYRT
jgi:hypothetical protein